MPVILIGVMLIFFTGISNLTQGRSEEDKKQLEQVLRRAAVACYAAEGIYPPTLSYMEEHYGIQIDRDRYTVMYDAYGANLLPDITVLEH